MSKQGFAAVAAKIDPDPYPYNGGFKVSLLTINDIDAFLALQEKVRRTLADDVKHHLKGRTREDLIAHVNAGMPLFGIKTDDGQLVGQALVSFPDHPAAKNYNGYPIYSEEKEKIALIQSVCIDPDFRGRDLPAMIHNHMTDIVPQYKRTVFLAKVADTNPASQKSFVNNGFNVAAKGLDPDKGYAATYFKKDVSVGCDAATQKLALVSKIA